MSPPVPFSSAPPPSVRHLETFYHVVRHGGICRAAGQPPHRIQQSAISEQILALESALDCKLFERQPFRLTWAGSRLYPIMAELFAALARTLPELRSDRPEEVRIGAEDVLIRHHLPAIVKPLKEADGAPRFKFQSAPMAEMIERLQAGSIDLTIAPMASRRLPPGLEAVAIVERPLALLVASSSDIHSADRFWAKDAAPPPLVCPGPQDGVTEIFRRGLERGGLHWPVQMEASSIASVASFVAGGTNVGVILRLACLIDRPGVRALPLPGFDPVPIYAVWRRSDTARLKTLVRRIRAAAPYW